MKKGANILRFLHNWGGVVHAKVLFLKKYLRN
jgi:hypothetical protein